MSVKSYLRIQKWKDDDERQVDMAKALQKGPKALHEQIKHGVSIDIEELPLVRAYAHRRGLSDKQFLDVLCEEGRELAKSRSADPQSRGSTDRSKANKPSKPRGKRLAPK